MEVWMPRGPQMECRGSDQPESANSQRMQSCQTALPILVTPSGGDRTGQVVGGFVHETQLG